MGNLERLVLVGFFSTVLIVTPYSVTDPINLPKMLAIGIFGFMCLGFLLQTENILRMRKTWVLPLLSLIFVTHALVVLIFTGRNISQGLYGVSGRNTGFVTYASLIFVCLAASLVSSKDFIWKFSKAFLILGLILVFYGIFQYLGLEPFPYMNIYENNVFGTFGNPNFHSAFVGIFGTFVFALCFDQNLTYVKRTILFSLVFLSVFGIYSTNSWQGFFNLAAGIGVASILFLFKVKKTKIASILLSMGFIVASFTALGLLNIGPLASILAKASLAARRLYWEAAFNMVLENPILGVGFDGFGDWYRRGRSEIAASQNAALISDSAHSIPLDIGSSGGLPLLIVYFALMGVTAISIVKVVRNTSHLSIPFIALSASWVSYQAQSLISINQIGLGVIGWILSGLIIGYAANMSVNTDAGQIHALGRDANNSAKSFTFATFSGPIIGFVVGVLISLPPFVAANKFYEGLKTSDARVINANAYLKPLDIRRMVVTANILEQNKFHKESLEITKSANRNFPDSFDAWTLLTTLTNSSESDKARAKLELKRLDPNLAP